MMANEKFDSEERLVELVEELSALCRHYEAALQKIVSSRQKEQEERKTRQIEGIANAKARGVKIGRKPVEIPDNFAELVEQWEEGDITLDFLLERIGMTRTTFFRRLREHRKKALS